MVICTPADTDPKRDFKMSTRPNEVMLGVRVPVELRRAVKRYVADSDTSVEALVNELLKATVAEGSTSAAVADRR
jgi:hypothetical protein